MKYTVLVALGVFCLSGQEPPLANPKVNTHDFLGLGPAPDVAAAKLGEPLYADNCSTCHGKNARGAQGPNLIRSPLVLHDEKGTDIGQVVKNGRAQGGMPAFPSLNDAQIYDIAEYIHLQVELAANRGTYRDTYAMQRNQISGNAAQGEAFFTAHCAGCHSVTGDLGGIGKHYPQASVMLSRIAWPVSTAPREATVMTKGGQKFSGVLLKDDDFDVELRDSSGTSRTWPKADVRVETQDKLAGHRALLPQYADADLHNLTAYLVSIK